MSNFNSLFQTVDALDSRFVYAFTNTNNSRTFENQPYILHILAIRWDAGSRMEAGSRFLMRNPAFQKRDDAGSEAGSRFCDAGSRMESLTKTKLIFQY